MVAPFEPPFGWDEVDEHPGEQCHIAHPDRPHKQPAQPPHDYQPIDVRVHPDAPMPPARTGPGGAFTSTPGAGADGVAWPEEQGDPWTRFDLWAQRAWDLASQAIDAAKAEGDRNAGLELSEAVKWDPRAQTIIDAARVCCDLAQASSPTGALPKMPSLDVTVPHQR